MKCVLAILASGYLLGGCAQAPATDLNSNVLHVYPDSAHNTVCYLPDYGYRVLSCVYVPPAPPAEPDGTYHVPPNPGSAYQGERIDRA